jgi:hypothetical protein
VGKPLSVGQNDRDVQYLSCTVVPFEVEVDKDGATRTTPTPAPEYKNVLCYRRKIRRELDLLSLKQSRARTQGWADTGSLSLIKLS